MQRHTMTGIVNHNRSTTLERSVHILLGLKSIVRGHNPRPWFCRGIHKILLQFARKGSNWSVQYLRKHKNQTNTEMKQQSGLDSKK